MFILEHLLGNSDAFIKSKSSYHTLYVYKAKFTEAGIVFLQNDDEVQSQALVNMTSLGNRVLVDKLGKMRSLE